MCCKAITAINLSVLSQVMMISDFMCYQDEEGHCFSDSFFELPTRMAMDEFDEDGGKKLIT